MVGVFKVTSTIITADVAGNEFIVMVDAQAIRIGLEVE
jgi:hypothetical protein